MPTAPAPRARSVGRDAIRAAGVSFVVAFVASLAIFPFSIGFLGVATPLGAFAVSLFFPIICDLYVYRKFFARHPSPSQRMFLVTGLAVSALVALFTWGPLIAATGA